MVVFASTLPLDQGVNVCKTPGFKTELGVSGIDRVAAIFYAYWVHVVLV